MYLMEILAFQLLQWTSTKVSLIKNIDSCVSALFPRIVNGTNAKPGEIPYIVSVHYKHSICGGVIVDDWHVLTAAHCVDKHYSYYIQYGTVEITPDHTKTISVAQIFFPENFNSSTFFGFSYDIALLKLSEVIPLNDFNVKSVILPAQGEAVKPGIRATISGWGSTDLINGRTVKHLQTTNITIYDFQKCMEPYKDLVNEKTQICGGDPLHWRGPCKSDSGSPVVGDGYKLLGINSWSGKPDGKCGSPKHPSIMIKVSAFVDWINTNLSLNNQGS